MKVIVIIKSGAIHTYYMHNMCKLVWLPANGYAVLRFLQDPEQYFLNGENYQRVSEFLNNDGIYLEVKSTGHVPSFMQQN